MCLHQAQLEESQRRVEQDVSEMVNKTRGDAVDRIMKLKKRYGCTKDDQQLAVSLSEVHIQRSCLKGMWPNHLMFHLLCQKKEVHELCLENSRLASLLCKLKAVSRWKQLVKQGKLHRQLLKAQQVKTKETACLLKQ